MAATAQLLGDLAEDLAGRGWEVTALAGRGSYAPGRKGSLPRRESFRGVEIRRVPSTNFGRGRMLGRVLDYATFFLGAGFAVLFGPRQEVVVALSTPPLVALLGLLARLRGSRFVYKVEDLYPDVAVALGTFRPGSPLARFFAALSRWILSRADATVALDGAMARRLTGRGARRTAVIPNWADGEAIRPDPEAGAALRRELDLPGDGLVLLYSGNLGLAHRFDAVTTAARRLAEAGDERIVFLFVGAGPRLAEVRQATAGLKNVRFLPYQARERLGALYNAADLHLITLREEVAGLLVPSKYAASLAAGKPVLLVGGRGTDLYDEIRRQGLGWALAHEAGAVIAALGEAVEKPAELAAMGARGRQIFETSYHRSGATGAWQDLIQALIEDPMVTRKNR